MNSSHLHTESHCNDTFIEAISAALLQYPDGLSEHQLIQYLRRMGYFGFLKSSPIEPLALFQAHFLLFHALYQLRDRLWQTGKAHLEIDALKIQYSSYQKGTNALSVPDALREYYLDLRNLEATTAVDVDELMASFWERLHRHDHRTEALASLGLSDPVDDETIKKTYRHLVMEHHPDRGGDHQRLQVINNAVAKLLKFT